MLGRKEISPSKAPSLKVCHLSVLAVKSWACGRTAVFLPAKNCCRAPGCWQQSHGCWAVPDCTGISLKVALTGYRAASPFWHQPAIKAASSCSPPCSLPWSEAESRFSPHPLSLSIVIYTRGNNRRNPGMLLFLVFRAAPFQSC